MHLKVKWVVLAAAVAVALAVAYYWAAQPPIKDLSECDVILVVVDSWHVSAFGIKPVNYTVKVYVDGRLLWPCNCTAGQASTAIVHPLLAGVKIEKDSASVCLSKQSEYFTTEDCGMRGRLICINDRGVFLIGERVYRIG